MFPRTVAIVSLLAFLHYPMCALPSDEGPPGLPASRCSDALRLSRRSVSVRGALGAVAVIGIGLGAFLNSGREIGYAPSSAELTVMHKGAISASFRDFETHLPVLCRTFLRKIEALESHRLLIRWPSNTNYLPAHFAPGLTQFLAHQLSPDANRPDAVRRKDIRLLQAKAKELGLDFPSFADLGVTDPMKPILIPHDTWVRAFNSRRTFAKADRATQEALLAHYLSVDMYALLCHQGENHSYWGITTLLDKEDEDGLRRYDERLKTMPEGPITVVGYFQSGIWTGFDYSDVFSIVYGTGMEGTLKDRADVRREELYEAYAKVRSKLARLWR